MGSYFPDRGLNPGPWQWKPRITTIRLPRKFSPTSFFFPVLVFFFFLVSLCIVWDLSSLTRDQTPIACVKKCSLNHWTTREIPEVPFKKLLKIFLFLKNVISCFKVLFVEQFAVAAWLTKLTSRDTAPGYLNRLGASNRLEKTLHPCQTLPSPRVGLLPQWGVSGSELCSP